MGADEERAQFLEVAVVLILDWMEEEDDKLIEEYEEWKLTFSHSPEVFATLDSPAIGSRDILSATNDGKRHGISEHTSKVSSRFVIGVNRRLVDTNSLGLNDFTNLII